MVTSLPTLGSQLDSARAKIRRANQHIRALKQSMERFGKRDVYRPGAKVYDPGFGAFLASREETFIIDRSPFGVLLPRPISVTRTLFDTAALTITLTPVDDYSAQFLRWGLLIGEIVHNIGSALDNLIWELAQASQAQWPAPPPDTASSRIRWNYQRRWNDLGFPYTEERKDWGGNCAKYLFFVPDATVRAVLEKAQAFYAWETSGTDPQAFALEIVHKLWNRDKHRTINVTAAGLQFGVTTVRIPDLFPGVDNLPSEVIEVFPIRPIEGETEMARILVHFPHEIPFPQSGRLEMNVLVKPEFSLAILFGQGSPGEGLNVLDRLQRARNLATQVMDRFT